MVILLLFKFFSVDRFWDTEMFSGQNFRDRGRLSYRTTSDGLSYCNPVKNED